MCRSIRPLFDIKPPVTRAESRAVALPLMRKVAGLTRSPRANVAAFDGAFDEVAGAQRRLLV